MDTNNTDLHSKFPELHDPEATLDRIADAFVAPEYARAAFTLMRSIVQRFGDQTRFGLSTVITAPHDYDNLILTISEWWFLNFHIADADSLEEGEDVERIVPLDYETILDREKDEEEWDRNGEDQEDEEDVDDDEIIEAT